jgi:hypothetical protein
MMNPQLDLFLDLIKKEVLRKKGVNWATLSTVSDEGPSARTVVLRTFRTINQEMLIRIYTHGLSAKVEQIKKFPKVELCWYLPAKSVQIQFSGKATILDDQDSSKIWNTIPSHSRKDYQGMKPGNPYEIKNSSDYHFSIIEVSVDRCVALKLGRGETHLKIKASKQDRWMTTRLLP